MSRNCEEFGFLDADQLQSIQNFFMKSSQMSDSDDDELTDEENNETVWDGEKLESSWKDFDDFDSYMEESAEQSPKCTDIERIRNLRWLQNGFIEAVGELDLITIAFKRRVITIEKIASKNFQYQILAEFDACDDLPSDVIISSICLLPMGSKRKTETSYYDWIVIIVGLSNGHLRFFSDHGVLLRKEEVSICPVQKIRFGRSILKGFTELAVIVGDKLIIFDGLPLYAALLATKNEIACGERDLNKIANLAKLEFAKVKLDSSHEPSDFLILGPSLECYFDRYMAASCSSEGPKAKLNRVNSLFYSKYLFIGASPFITYERKLEEKAYTNVFSTTLHNITSQVTSSFFSSLSSFGLNSNKLIRGSTETIATKRINSFLETRSIMVDDGRQGFQVIKAPSRYNYAVVTDSLARVILIDTSTRRIIRIWKGYRDVQCGWIESESVFEKKLIPPILFLIIFARRRGLLEVWSMPNGRRVSAMNVDKRGHLIYVPPMAEQLISCNFPPSTPPHSFFLSSDGKIVKLCSSFYDVSFERNRIISGDENNIKEMSFLLRKPTSKNLDIWLNIFRKLRSGVYVKRALDEFMECGGIDCKNLRNAYEIMRDHIVSHPSLITGPEGKHMLMTMLSNILRLLDVYEKLENVYREEITMDDSNIDPNLLEDFYSDIDFFNKYKDPTVSICDEEPDSSRTVNSFAEFLSHFDITYTQDTDANLMNENPCFQLCVKKQSAQLGSFLFKYAILGKCSTTYLCDQVLGKLNISSNVLLDLFVLFWLNYRRMPNKIVLNSFVEIAKTILLLNENSFEALELLEKRLFESHNVYAGSLLCRMVNSFIRKPISIHDEMDEITDLSLHRWESYLKNFHCMVLLNNLPEFPEICLQDLLNTGPSYYREKLALWCCRQLIDPNQYRALFIDDSLERPLIRWKQIIIDIREILLSCLKLDLMMCDCAWECMSSFIKSNNKTKELEYSLIYLQLLSEFPRQQHGLCRIFWDTFFLQPFHQIWDLMNKKDHQFTFTDSSLKDISILPNHLLSFISASERILEMLLRSIADLELHQPMDVCPEPFIDDFFRSNSKAKIFKEKRPLANVVVHQKVANFHLVLHHCDVAMLLHLIVSLNIHIRPDKLFDEVSRRALFISLIEHPLIPLDQVDETIRKRRQNFMEDCVEEICLNRELDNCWKQILDLSNDWKLDICALKIKEICSLYIHGHDSEALKLISSVEKPIALAEKLFFVLLAHVKFLIDEGDQDLISFLWKNAAIDNRLLELMNKEGKNINIVKPSDPDDLLQFIELIESLLAGKVGQDHRYARFLNRLRILVVSIKHARL